jgi:hypothetical protein
MSLNTSSLASSTLNVDSDGDGSVDEIVHPTVEQTEELDITPPELVINFSTTTNKVVLSAVDIVDQNPSIFTTSTSTTIRDTSGNTTIVPFIKFTNHKEKGENKEGEVEIAFNKIIRNGVATSTPTVKIKFEWELKRGKIDEFKQTINTKGVDRYTFDYKREKNVTIVSDKLNSSTNKLKKQGFVSALLTTGEFGLVISY